MHDGVTSSSLLRLIGITAMCVGAAWVLQVLGFGGSSASGRMLWVVSAAAIAGIGAGLIYTSTALVPEKDGSLKA